jgi:hypothetical protein
MPIRDFRLFRVFRDLSSLALANIIVDIGSQLKAAYANES